MTVDSDEYCQQLGVTNCLSDEWTVQRGNGILGELYIDVRSEDAPTGVSPTHGALG